LLSVPGVGAARRDGLASSIDIAQTLLELTGCTPYHDMQGVSLVPMLSDERAKVRDCVLIEEDQREDVFGTGSPFRSRTLVRETARTTVYEGLESGEHYDLSIDPGEMENRWSDRAARSAALEQLLQEMLRVGDHTPRPKYTA